MDRTGAAKPTIAFIDTGAKQSVTMSEDATVTITVGQDGVEYSEKGMIGWMTEEYTWDEIGEIEIDNPDELEANGHDGPFPIKIVGHVTIGKNEGQPHPEEEDSESTRDVLKELYESEGVRVDMDAEEVEFDTDLSDSDNFTKFFKFLNDDGFLSPDDLPFKTPRQSNFILNTEPIHPDGDKMSRPSKVASKIWLETSVPEKQKKHHMIEAVKEFVK